MATLLGVRRVGWVIAHPPREEGFFLSGYHCLTHDCLQLMDGGVRVLGVGAEVITAAELQLEAADGIADTPFVTVSVRKTYHSLYFTRPTTLKQSLRSRRIILSVIFTMFISNHRLL